MAEHQDSDAKYLREEVMVERGVTLEQAFENATTVKTNSDRGVSNGYLEDFKRGRW